MKPKNIRMQTSETSEVKIKDAREGKKESVFKNGVAIGEGTFGIPHEFIDVPDGGDVLFCGDGYCTEDFVRVAFSHYRMRKITTREDAENVSGGYLAVIAAGGETAVRNGKIAAIKTGLPLVIFAFDLGFAGYGDRVLEIIERDGSVVKRTVGRDVKVVFDTAVSCDPDRVAAGYGAICTSLVYLFEKEVGSVLFSTKYDRRKAATALKAVADAIKAEITSDPSEAVARGLASLTEAFGGERFVGGESVAKVAELLKKRKSREENAALLCRETLCVYRLVLRLVAPSVSVPDVNARLDIMARRFGISPAVLTSNIRGYMPAGELARVLYCVREYAPELDLKAVAYLKILDFSFKRFKRLYKDRGFSYNDYMSADEKKLCFALAPDVGSPFTLLDVARETGLTDALLRTVSR